VKLVAANGSPTELGAFYNELQPEASHLDGYQRRTEERDGKTYGWTQSGRRVLLRRLVDGKAKLTGAGRAYYHTNRVRFVAHVPTINNADDRYWLDYRPVTDQRLNIDLPSSMDGRDGPPDMDALRDRLQSMYEAKLFAQTEVNPAPTTVPPLPDASRGDGERRALPVPNNARWSQVFSEGYMTMHYDYRRRWKVDVQLVDSYGAGGPTVETILDRPLRGAVRMPDDFYAKYGLMPLALEELGEDENCVVAQLALCCARSEEEYDDRYTIDFVRDRLDDAFRSLYKEGVFPYEDGGGARWA
jgi:hypothetical protein